MCLSSMQSRSEVNLLVAFAEAEEPFEVTGDVGKILQVRDHGVRPVEEPFLAAHRLQEDLAEVHGGELQLDSALGRGTTITVCLPTSRITAKTVDAA